MYWEGSEILLSKYPYIKGDLEKLDKYISDLKLKHDYIIDISHISVLAKIPETNIKSILEKGADIGIIEKVYRLKCGKKDSIVYIQDDEYELPAEFFCDLCGEEHEFTSKDVIIGYKLKFIYSDNEMKEIRDKMPVMGRFANKLSSELVDEKPFSGKTCLVVLHFLKDILIFLESCEKLGLEPPKSHVFYKPYLYPHVKPIISHLQAHGYNVLPLKSLNQVLNDLNRGSQGTILILEDGGYIVPLLHNEFAKMLPRVIGAVEQTTRGIRNDKAINKLEIPILSVAEANIKTEMEPAHVADAVVRNLESLLSDENFRGKRVAILGYGVIGKNIAERLSQKGMHITVYDPRPDKRVAASEIGYDTVGEAYNASKDQFLIIGCSGETSISRKEISNLGHQSYLVSASSDQREIDLEELMSLSLKREDIKHNGRKIGIACTLRGQKGKVINLLADGYPINFWYSESMPNQVSDLILSLIFLSGLELCIHKDKFINGINQVNAIADDYNLMGVYEDFY